jgi:cell fate (sporulation/competence/biofilm development) regulator YlbF (YheA/YmcA/DUF963 family)
MMTGDDTNMPEFTLSTEMEAATDALVRSLLEAGPLADFRRADAAMASDAAAAALVEEMEELQTGLRRKQGDVTDEDIERLRRLRRETESNPTIAAAVETRDAAAAMLAEVSREISRELGVDFSAFARRGCHG